MLYSGGLSLGDVTRPPASAEHQESTSLGESHDAEVLAAASLADLVEEHEREARRRLVEAAVWTVAGSLALTLLLVLKRDAATTSAVVFMVTLLATLLTAVWGRWWLFARSDLDDIRRLAARNRVLRPSTVEETAVRKDDDA